MADIEIRRFQRFTRDRVPHYEVLLEDTATGQDRVHHMPVEAVATRGELLGLTHEEALDLILNEPFAPEDEIHALYTDNYRRREKERSATSRVHRARKNPLPRALDATVRAVDAVSGDSDRIAGIRAWKGVKPGPGWDEAARQLREDEDELRLHRSLLVAEELAGVYQANDM